MPERVTFLNAQEGSDLYFIGGGGIVAMPGPCPGLLSHRLFITIKKIPRLIPAHMLNEGILMIATNEKTYTLTRISGLDSVGKVLQGNDLRNANFSVDNKGDVWVYNMSGTLWRHRPGNIFEPLHLIPSGYTFP